ncbi:MAG: 3-deoxy-manno-octulosonate cytidylyltransferase [Rikenellaceae bacterium]|nr:3-deoxy-manno-octulosonate cytidylyltransferase [Rikenellaceae bacterium]
MNILALIPARYSSTRFPGKPLAMIGGRPMIRHVYERAGRLFSDIFVATDDLRIAREVSAFGGKWIMTGDYHQSGTDRCAEALDKAEAITGKKYDVVVNIQGDEPFISSSHLESLVALFDDPLTEIGTLVRRFGPGEDFFDPNCVKVVLSRGGSALYFSRLPIPYIREKGSSAGQTVVFYKHIGLYAYRAGVLRTITALAQGMLERAESLEQLRWLENGFRIDTALVHGETLAVDTPEDLERVEHHYRQIDDNSQ